MTLKKKEKKEEVVLIFPLIYFLFDIKKKNPFTRKGLKTNKTKVVCWFIEENPCYKVQGRVLNISLSIQRANALPLDSMVSFVFPCEEYMIRR